MNFVKRLQFRLIRKAWKIVDVEIESSRRKKFRFTSSKDLIPGKELQNYGEKLRAWGLPTEQGVEKHPRGDAFLLEEDENDSWPSIPKIYH